MTRFFILLAGVTGIVALGLIIDRQSRAPVERPSRIAASTQVFALGRIEGATPEIPLRFEKEGRVVEVLVQEGQSVRQGTVLVRLDDAEHAHGVALAQAELALAQAQLERVISGAREQERNEAKELYKAKVAALEGVQLAWQRTEGLLKGNAISQQEADDLRTRLAGLSAEVGAAKARMELLEAPPRPDDIAIAQAGVLAAKARLDLANYRLELTRLRALGDGQILNVDVEVGELTGPAAEQPVVVMADTSRFRVRAYVEELDALKLAIGMRARITSDAFGNRQLEGVLVQLSPQMGRKQLWNQDPAERYDTKTREIWVDLEQSQGELLIGLPVDVIIDVASGSATASASRVPPSTIDR